MKRHIAIVSFVLATAMVFTACQKDDNSDNNDNGLVSFNLEIGNYDGAGNTKMYVDASRYTHWTSGDQVKINNDACPVDVSKAQITGVTASSYGYTAVYPASIATSYFGATTTSFNVTLPTTQTYSVDGSGNQIISAPMVARSVTSSNGNLSGVATISNATTTPSFAMGTGANSYNYVTLSFSSETVSQGTSKDYYVVLPAFNESDLTISIFATSTGNLELSKTASDATLSANTIVQGPVLSLDGVAFIGTEENPYKIYNLDDLVAFRTKVNSGTTYEGLFVKVMDDIDCGSSWTPIGTSSNYFKGTFDGNNKTITYVIPSTNAGYLGLFGYTQNAIIKNLNVDATITQTGSNGNIGGIVARQEGGTITNSTAAGTISSEYSYIGGIVGRNYGSTANTVSSCTSNVNITSSKSNLNYIGGILGYFYTTGIVSNCTASGNIYAPEETGTYVGGIVGNTTGTTSVATCSFTGCVRASGYVGMIAGSRVSNSVTISSCTYSAVNAGTTYKGVGVYNNRTGNDIGCTAE